MISMRSVTGLNVYIDVFLSLKLSFLFTCCLESGPMGHGHTARCRGTSLLLPVIISNNAPLVKCNSVYIA
jgi:hypothetical protein